ncbi:hypothetical protein KC316_g1536 [Hortaea werneckii]|uniref:BZIP domain-containing protein n=2 Tax=Hortaea werneckii TaxID=91943 RepID=A0A3M6YGC2_HORWE|nr:hypothetical protein KC324_g1475 [Hortaea werneckii]KAI7593745.1 hypothetical protein KC316_g1536 [Hortaea werneckii]RMY02060.1 hypothetical protein D0868_08164 [Hortaea werneckii]
METLSHLSTPAMNTHDHRRDSTMTSDQFLKMEDLHSSASPSPSFDPQDASPAPDASQASPAPVIVQSKPAKKRKSWGQELPEPKTHLPPRKRAKTDDEKEQRRIERIKRNRAAAHNSRERKRQETETLAVALARANAELEAYRRLHGPLPANIQLPDVQLSSDMVDTPAPSLVESHGTAEAAPSPSSPATHMFHLHQDQHIKQEPLDHHPFPSTIPPAFETSHLDSKPTLSPLDQTQHSAAMLCDLQCRSSPASSINNTRSRIQPHRTSTSPSSFWAALSLHLMMLQIQTCYKTLLVGIWSLSPSRMARMMQASTHRLTSRSMTSSMTTPLLLRSTAMAQRNAATSRLARQGALVALQRSSTDDVFRARVKTVRRDAKYHHRSRQRKALKREPSRHNNNDVVKSHDGNAGV